MRRSPGGGGIKSKDISAKPANYKLTAYPREMLKVQAYWRMLMKKDLKLKTVCYLLNKFEVLKRILSHSFGVITVFLLYI